MKIKRGREWTIYNSPDKYTVYRKMQKVFKIGTYNIQKLSPCATCGMKRCKVVRNPCGTLQQ